MAEIRRDFEITSSAGRITLSCRLTEGRFSILSEGGSGASVTDLAAECPATIASELLAIDGVRDCLASGVPAGGADGPDEAAAQLRLAMRLKGVLVDRTDLDGADRLLRGAVPIAVLSGVRRSVETEVAQAFDRLDTAAAMRLTGDFGARAIAFGAQLAERGRLRWIGLLRLERLRRSHEALVASLGAFARLAGLSDFPIVEHADQASLATALDRLGRRAIFVNAALRGAILPLASLRREVKTAAAIRIIDATVIAAAIPVWRERATEARAALERPHWRDPRLTSAVSAPERPPNAVMARKRSAIAAMGKQGARGLA